MTRQMVFVVAAVLLAGGCSTPDSGGGGDYVANRAPSTARQQVREHADQVAATAKVTLGAAREESLTCPGEISDYPANELYRMQGTYELPITADEQESAYARLTKVWIAASLAPSTGDAYARGPWAGPADLKVGLRDGFTAALARTSGTTVRLTVLSDCLHDNS